MVRTKVITFGLLRPARSIAGESIWYLWFGYNGFAKIQ